MISESVSGLQMKDGVYTILFETTVTDPMAAAGKTYKWISTFTDLNGKGVVKATFDVEVIE